MTHSLSPALLPRREERIQSDRGDVGRNLVGRSRRRGRNQRGIQIIIPRIA